ncbi:substrate-binding domain-containing protein [Nakamurella endophytica]|uniref:Periplasmic binding protein domain-containing protein n=1 Tax=Nakamurella endophytica TaxID=1748367 RepID=A0A917ST27_9ACTN|nr:substrate-binding domain-containing protein [Nakamurella endophytica]GGL94789.1 hypothetical protein GCM10011594_13250 [Nakamurella endophytica]
MVPARRSGRRSRTWQRWLTLVAASALAVSCASGATTTSGSASSSASGPAPTSDAATATAGSGTGAASSATGTGASSGTAATGTASSATGSAPSGGEVGLSAVPKGAQQYYGSYDTFAKLFPDPYADWTPPPAPWKFCLNDSYLGNQWRQDNLAELERQVKLYQQAGLASGPLVSTNSDNNISLQLSQFNTLVGQGCTVIFSIPGSPTALCDSFKTARSKNVLVVTDESPVYCSDAINVSWNGYWAEYVGAKAVLEGMGGKGNLVSIAGIPGVPLAVAEQIAVRDALKDHPDVKHLGEVAGAWTPSVTKTEMSKFLATHPQKVDGVIDAGAEDVAAVQALQSAGRPLPKINSITGECSFLALWKQHPEIGTLATNQSPSSAAYETFLVAARKLAGQKLAVNTVFYPVPQITADNLDQWYRSSMTVDSTCIPTSPDGRATPDSYFDQFFSGGNPVKVMPVPQPAAS